jgi:hypothetical protein
MSRGRKIVIAFSIVVLAFAYYKLNKVRSVVPWVGGDYGLLDSRFVKLLKRHAMTESYNSFKVFAINLHQVSYEGSYGLVLSSEAGKYSASEREPGIGG